MITAGIIAEYNPFHSGHKYHIEETRRRTGADFIVVAMSGDFVQRGEPASADKYLRTRMALKGGADLVLELPAIYATSSAEYFATAGVCLLEQLHCVEYLSFGSEWADLDTLKKVVNVLTEESKKYYMYLKESLKKGKNFPSARSNALTSVLDGDLSEEATRILAQPNHILALEYLKSLQRMNAAMIPVAVRRKGAGYLEDDVSLDYPSATALRKALSDYKQYILFADRKEHIPSGSKTIYNSCGQSEQPVRKIFLDSAKTEENYRKEDAYRDKDGLRDEYEHRNEDACRGEDDYRKIFQESFGELAEEYIHRYLSGDMVDWEDLMPYLRYTFLMDERGIDCCFGMNGDRTARFRKVFRPDQSFSELMEGLHAKSYTDAAWRRALLHMVLHMEKQSFLEKASEVPVPYARILGFSRRAAPLLKKMQEKADVPLIQKPVQGRTLFEKDTVASWIYSMDIRAAQLYEQIAAAKAHRGFVSEWTRQQIIVD
ncbi:MAG: nucleotidyltransferase family protein [Clostridiales bacterium]|nr:nucleotidyltransferase family protein [Clostridiales bacterium]